MKTTATSVFYNRSSLHHLVVQVLRPFIESEKELNTIEYWGIYLSQSQGDHISLAIKSANSDRLQKKFSDLTEKFFLTDLSSKNKTTFPPEGFFMDYPNNSIQLNNRRLFPQHREQKNQNIGQAISQAIVDALGNEVINTESIYTFFIYTLLGIIKTVYPAISKARGKAAGLLRYLDDLNSSENGSRAVPPADHVVLIQIIEKNTEVLPAIIHDVWNENPDSELNWLIEWIAACRNFIKDRNFNENFFSLSSLLCTHLGLEDKIISPLSCRLVVNSFNSIKIS